MGLIVLFFPAIISIFVELHINNKKNINKEEILKYFIYCFFINFIGNFIVWLISKEKFYFYNSMTFTYDFCFKYMFITSIVSIVLPIIFKIISDNLKISVIVKEKAHDKKNNK